MNGMLEGMKNITLCENSVTIKSTMKEDTVKAIETLAEERLA